MNECEECGFCHHELGPCVDPDYERDYEKDKWSNDDTINDGYTIL